MRGKGAGVLLAALLAAAAAAVPSLAATAATGTAGDGACSWPMYGHDPRRSFAQAAGCSALSPLAAPSVAPAWFFPTPDSVTASPAVDGGRVYVGSWDGTFYALAADPPPGPVRPLWTFQVTDANDTAFGRIVSSAAVVHRAGRAVVLFGGGATVYALDGETGAELASVCLDPRAGDGRCAGSDDDIEVESSPAVVSVAGQTVVLVGLDVHNNRGVGRTGVVALRLDTKPWALQPLWKADPETGLAYVADPAAAGPGVVAGVDPLTYGAGEGDGCGGVWSSPAVDVGAGLVAFGTSSCSVDGITSGESMYGVRLDTGAQVWAFHPPRVSTRDDDDFGASPNLLPGGLVGEGSKDGWYYALDRATGALAWSSHAGESGHVTGDFAVGGILGSTALGAVGAPGAEPAVFATTALSTPVDRPMPPLGAGTADASLASDPGRMLSLHAISARDGRVLWRAPLSRASYGAPVYSNGVVLVPSTFDFTVEGFDAASGVPVFTIPLNGPPSSSPVVVGDLVLVGTGTRTTDAEYKAFGAGALEPAAGASPLSPLSGVWALRVTADQAR